MRAGSVHPGPGARPAPGRRAPHAGGRSRATPRSAIHRISVSAGSELGSYRSISIGRLKLDTSRCATFKPSELAAQLLAVVENAGRQEVFPVLDANQRLVGLITLEDLMALAAESDLDQLVCATDIMRPPIALHEHDLASRALELMMSVGVRELPVVDEDHHLVGVIDEATIAHEYVRVRAAGHADAAASGVRAIDPGVTS